MKKGKIKIVTLLFELLFITYICENRQKNKISELDGDSTTGLKG